MSYLRESGLTEENFPLFADLRRDYGVVLNFFKAQGLRPDLMAAQAALFGGLFSGGALSRRQKEYIAVAVSGDNMSTYCVTLHCEFLRAMGLTDPELDQLGVDHRLADLPARDAALLDFAVKLTRRPGAASQADVAKLREVGFTDEEILDAVLTTALMNFANRVSLGLGARPDFPPRTSVRG